MKDYRTRVGELVAGLADADPEQSLEAREAIRALVNRIVLTPSPEDPTVPTVDLEGALAGLLVLATAREGRSSNANKATPLGTVLQSVLVEGAVFGLWRTEPLACSSVRRHTHWPLHVRYL